MMAVTFMKRLLSGGWQAKEKKVKEGDEVLLKREKSTTKSP